MTQCEAIVVTPVRNASKQIIGHKETRCRKPVKWRVSFLFTGQSSWVCGSHVRKYREHKPKPEPAAMGRLMDAALGSNESIATVVEL